MEQSENIYSAPDPFGDDPMFEYPDYPEMDDKFVIPQHYERYSDDDHKVWQELFARQEEVLEHRGCKAYRDALAAMDLPHDAIPRFEDTTALLKERTNWEIVAVPGLIPNTAFFDHLANRRFPVTHWMRKREEMDYLEEPDVFHDFYGHVPLLMQPEFADYMQLYGKAGAKAMRMDALPNLSRLYWYTVEFGLIREEGQLRIYGAGILSSKKESIYSLESDVPNRVAFDIERIMRSDYRIDDVQDTYFVIDSFEQLLKETRDTDFAPIYERVVGTSTHAANARLDSDVVIPPNAA